MSKNLYLQNQVYEARHSIPEGMAMSVTYAAVAESGLRNFYKEFYGGEFNKELTLAKQEQQTVDVSDEIFEDIREMLSVNKRAGLMETHTTSDFPIALAAIRQRTLRAEYTGVDSTWRTWPGVSITSRPNFMPSRGIRLGELPQLFLRPEATDVKYITWSTTEDGMRIANYEAAIAYTWEMWLADEVGLFNRQATSLGRAARRTEALIVLAQLIAGVARSAESGVTTGLPNSTNLQNAATALARRTFTDSAGKAFEFGLRATGLIHATGDEFGVRTALGMQYTDFMGGNPNPILNAFTPYLETLLTNALVTAGISQRDWFLFDGNSEWMEVAFLEGFQGGPKTYTRLPNVREHTEEGSFENHTLAIKTGHALGAKIVDASRVIRVQGA